MHYDFHARQYDPHLGLFTSPDPLSGDYPALSSYLYCAGNPVMFTDPTGMIITDELKKAIDPLFQYARERKINCNLITQLKSMYKALKRSNQKYDLKTDITLQFDKGATKYNQDNNSIVMCLPVEQDCWTTLIVHELVHMYQFEKGKMSFSYSKDSKQKSLPTESPGFIHDLTDELEAYNMASMFGGPQRTLDNLKVDHDYSNLSPMPKNIETYIEDHWPVGEGSYLPKTEQNIKNMLQGWAMQFKVVFRYNNQSYMPPKKKNQTQETIEQQNENTKMVNIP